MLVSVTALALAILGDFVDANFVIPAGHGEEVGSVGRGRKGEVGDAICRRIAERDVAFQVARRVACSHGARGGAKKA